MPANTREAQFPRMLHPRIRFLNSPSPILPPATLFFLFLENLVSKVAIIQLISQLRAVHLDSPLVRNVELIRAPI